VNFVSEPGRRPLVLSPKRKYAVPSDSISTAKSVSVGPSASRSTLLDALGQQVDAVTVHQAFFVGWAAVTGLHTLARLGPALALAGRPSGVPGERRRLAALIMTLVIAVIAAILLLGTANPWRHAGHRHHAERPAAAAERVPGGTAGPQR